MDAMIITHTRWVQHGHDVPADMQTIATAHCATRTGCGIDPRQSPEIAIYDHEYVAPAAMAGDMVAALAAAG